MDKNITSTLFLYVNEDSCRCTCHHLIIRLEDLTADVSLFAMNIIVLTITVLTMIPSIALNMLVLMAYIKNRTLQTKFNMSLMILAVSDLLVAAIVQPVFVVKTVAGFYTDFHCFLWATHKIVSQFGHGNSLMTIATISVERYLSLAFPFRYLENVTKSRLGVVFALFSSGNFLGVLVLSFVPGNGFKTVLLSTGIVMALSLIAGCWLWINRLTKRHKRQINALSKRPAVVDLTKIARNTKTCYLVVGSSLACFLPTLISVVVYHIIHVFRANLSYFVQTRISPFLHVLMNVYSLLNPLILLYRKRDFRQTVINMMRKK